MDLETIAIVGGSLISAPFLLWGGFNVVRDVRWTKDYFNIRYNEGKTTKKPTLFSTLESYIGLGEYAKFK